MRRILFFTFCLYSALLFSQKEISEAEYEAAGDSAVVESVEKVAEQYRPENSLDADSLLRTDYRTSNKVDPKALSPKFRSKYKSDEFDYTTIKPKESLWDRLKRRLEKLFDSLFGKINFGGINDWTVIVLKVLGIILIGVVLYFVLKLLFDKQGNLIFSKKNRKVEISATDLSENIHEIDFPSSILAYEKRKEFRMAIRYQFLYVLKKMEDQKIIKWNPEKTNRDYYNEIQDSRIKETYRELALIFDYVWYGEFDIDEHKYQTLKNQFQNAKF